MLSYLQLSYFSKLNHSAIVDSSIRYNVKLFWYSKPNHFCYSELGHFATVLDHFMILSAILEILLAIFHFYSAQSFLIDTVCEAA
jgi:hypothetical protein